VIPPILNPQVFWQKKGGYLHRIIYLDPEIIQQFKSTSKQSPDPAIVTAVSEAIEKLDHGLRRVVHERYFEGLSLPEIAARNGIGQREVIGNLYEAKRLLKLMLADFVSRRWGVKPPGICRVCTHPKREIIENILKTVDGSSSWAEICRRVEAATGERFHPPQILKAHQKHIFGTNKEKK